MSSTQLRSQVARMRIAMEEVMKLSPDGGRVIFETAVDGKFSSLPVRVVVYGDDVPAKEFVIPPYESIDQHGDFKAKIDEIVKTNTPKSSRPKASTAPVSKASTPRVFKVGASPPFVTIARDPAKPALSTDPKTPTGYDVPRKRRVHHMPGSTPEAETGDEEQEEEPPIPVIRDRGGRARGGRARGGRANKRGRAA